MPPSAAKKRSESVKSRPDTERTGLRRGLTLEERAQERREALIQSAIELFGTEGYMSTSVKDVCSNAYVSPRDFYELFENREQLLLEVGQRIEQRILDAFAAAYEQSTARMEIDRMLDSFRAGIEALTDDPRIARIAFIEQLAVSESQQQARRRRIRQFGTVVAELLQEDFAKAGLDQVHTEAAAVAIIGGANELIEDWVVVEPRPPASELIDLVIDTVRYLLPKSTKRSTSESLVDRLAEAAIA
jgi:AcrR family transcriptional regulator